MATAFAMRELSSLIELTGRTAIVTGGGSGIGRAISEAFAGAGAKVAIFDLDADAAGETAGAIVESGGEARFFPCDVSSESSVREAVAGTVEAFAAPGILVNNAGIAHIGSATSTTEEDFDRVFRVNAKGAYLCLAAVLPHMVEAKGGVVLNLSSIAAISGLKERFAYSASKGAVHTMTYSVAADYLQHGIRCNAICPARVHTPFVEGYLAKNYPENRDEMFQKLSEVQPIGRMAKPEEVAALALYLCSDAASYITGQAFNLDGGYLSLRV